MIRIDWLKNKTVGVVGLGKTGQAVVDSLNLSGAHVKLFDDNEVTDENYRKFFCKSENFCWSELDLLIVSPGIHLMWPKPHETVRQANLHNILVRNDLDIFQLQTYGKKICITGTNGKSTTTALINHIFEKNSRKIGLGGNIGVPVLSLADDCDFYALEISSYTLESCTILGADTAILLNITPDHLARHGGMAGYISTKQKIFANPHKNSHALISIDDERCREIFDFLKKTQHPNVIPFSGVCVPDFGIGWNEKNELVDNRFGKNCIICQKSETLDGQHNRQNIAAAFGACVLNGLSEEEFCRGLFSFTCLEHRQELVAKINGIYYVNDSKATNAESVEQALMRYDNVHIILGGRAKENGINSLVKYFSKIRRAFLIGEAAEYFQKILAKNGVATVVSGDLKHALDDSLHFLQQDQPKVVLLSPACASFDQFSSFEERGKIFKQLVGELEKNILKKSA